MIVLNSSLRSLLWDFESEIIHLTRAQSLRRSTGNNGPQCSGPCIIADDVTMGGAQKQLQMRTRTNHSNLTHRQHHSNIVRVNSSSASAVGSYDVICGRNKVALNNIGNRRFRVAISLSLERYAKASTRQEKTRVFISVMEVGS